jgi:polyisoprenoid-binding protein YceI
MVKELKGEKFSSIDYTLTEMTVSGEVPTSGSPVTFDTKGKLSVAGQTNEVSFPVTMERLGEDKLRFKGSLKTKMTAFGVTPPEFTVLGVGSKTADDITLTWKWTVGLKAEAPKP